MCIYKLVDMNLSLGEYKSLFVIGKRMNAS